MRRVSTKLTAERELLPYFRAHREDPVVHVRRVDLLARRQDTTASSPRRRSRGCTPGCRSGGRGDRLRGPVGVQARARQVERLARVRVAHDGAVGSVASRVERAVSGTRRVGGDGRVRWRVVDRRVGPIARVRRVSRRARSPVGGRLDRRGSVGSVGHVGRGASFGSVLDGGCVGSCAVGSRFDGLALGVAGARAGLQRRASTRPWPRGQARRALRHASRKRACTRSVPDPLPAVTSGLGRVQCTNRCADRSLQPNVVRFVRDRVQAERTRLLTEWRGRCARRRGGTFLLWRLRRRGRAPWRAVTRRAAAGRTRKTQVAATRGAARRTRGRAARWTAGQAHPTRRSTKTRR